MNWELFWSVLAANLAVVVVVNRMVRKTLEKSYAVFDQTLRITLADFDEFSRKTAWAIKWERKANLAFNKLPRHQISDEEKFNREVDGLTFKSDINSYRADFTQEPHKAALAMQYQDEARKLWGINDGNQDEG